MTEQNPCPCKKKQCERHGDCAACRAYHAESKRKRPVACEKEKGGGFSRRKPDG